VNIWMCYCDISCCLAAGQTSLLLLLLQIDVIQVM
jgi:hypothetical protein